MATIAEAQAVPVDNAAALNEKVANLTVAEKTTLSESSEASTVSEQPVEHATTSEKPVESTTGSATNAATTSVVPDKPFALEETEPKAVFKLPLAYPLPSCKPAPAAELSEAQKQKYEDVLNTVSAWTELRTAVAASASKSPITDDERMWLTRECILRYLRATKWDVNNAVTRLHNTLAWRREYGLEKLTPEHIGPENETGKQVILGYDNEGRPVLYMDPSKQNHPESLRQEQHFPFLLERMIEIMPPGQETVTLVINFKNTSRKTNPSVQMAMAGLNQIQNHFPERLGRALLSELPWYISIFLKIIDPFIDPVTKTKLRFNEPFVNHIPVAQLQKPYGGEADFVYDHAEYWPALNAFAKHRKDEFRQRWIARGKKIGDDEWILKGGEPKE